MQASAFLRSLKAENVPPVLLLVGTETVLRRRVISRLAKLLLSEVDEEAAFERLDAGVTGLMKILDTASTGSLLTGHPLSAPSGSAGLAALERYLDSPNPASTLVLEADAARKNRRPFTLLAREGGYSLPPGAGALIINMLGSDLMTIYNALDKVMLYCGERKQIEYEDLERCLNIVREHTIREVINAVGGRDAAAALAALGQLLDEGKHPLQISSWLKNQVRTLMIVRDMLDRRLPSEKVASAAGLRYKPERVFKQARLFSSEELVSFHRLLFELENRIKSAGVDERYLLEDMLYRICRTGKKHLARGRSA